MIRASSNHLENCRSLHILMYQNNTYIFTTHRRGPDFLKTPLLHKKPSNYPPIDGGFFMLEPTFKQNRVQWSFVTEIHGLCLSDPFGCAMIRGTRAAMSCRRLQKQGPIRRLFYILKSLVFIVIIHYSS